MDRHFYDHQRKSAGGTGDRFQRHRIMAAKSRCAVCTGEAQHIFRFGLWSASSFLFDFEPRGVAVAFCVARCTNSPTPKAIRRLLGVTYRTTLGATRLRSRLVESSLCYSSRLSSKVAPNGDCSDVAVSEDCTTQFLPKESPRFFSPYSAGDIIAPSVSRSPIGSEPRKRIPETTTLSASFAPCDHLYSRSTTKLSDVRCRLGARSQDRSRLIARVIVSSLPCARTSVFAVFGSSSNASSFECAT